MEGGRSCSSQEAGWAGLEALLGFEFVRKKRQFMLGA